MLFCSSQVMDACICTEQSPSTSHSAAPRLKRSNSLRTPSSINDRIQEYHSRNEINNQESDAQFAIELLPSELKLKIFKNLPRTDIENCKLVCRQWHALINANCRSLPKHILRLIAAGTDKDSFYLIVRTSENIKKYSFRNPPLSAEPPSKRRHTYGIEKHRSLLPKLFLYQYDDSLPMCSSICGMANRETDEEHNERKINQHTPPQAFFDKLAHVCRYAELEKLRITEMRLTDKFVQKLLQAFQRSTMRCKELEMTFCKLRYIRPKNFEKLVNWFDCEGFLMMWMRENAGHISNCASFISSIRFNKLTICSVTPDLLLADDDFLSRFLAQKSATKYLRLDSCSITNSGFVNAIKTWQYASEPWMMHIVLTSNQMNYAAILRDFAEELISDNRAYKIKHLKRGNDWIQLWEDGHGIHASTDDISANSVLS